MNITVKVEFLVSATVRTLAYVYDEDGVLVAPTGSIKVTITEPDGTVQADEEAMIATADTGVYEHYWRTTSAATKGWYENKVVVVDGSGALAVTSIQAYSFRMK